MIATAPVQTVAYAAAPAYTYAAAPVQTVAYAQPAAYAWPNSYALPAATVAVKKY